MKRLLTSLTPLLLEATACIADGPLAPWTAGVRIAPVSAIAERHSMHSYYLSNPESPDGTRVVFFTSTDPAARVGEVRMIERATGKETVLAENVRTEDAHRVACQQWLSGGKRVAYHEVRDNQWRVISVDVGTLEKTLVAENHQIGFGRPDGDLLPIYGCHWNPGPFRDMKIWDASTGKLRTAATIAEVEARYGAWLQTEFQGKPTSIFFPILSPDMKRVFFKIAAGSGGDNFMTKGASHRQGIVCYDLEKATCIWQRAKWGHPAWHPDSRHIYEAGNLLFDVETESSHYDRVADLPKPRGMHPAVSPDGKLMVTDGICDTYGGKPGEWGIIVGDMRGGKWTLVHSFDQSQGAKSWRTSHPHPVFSADGKRIYFNVSDGPFTRLLCAEAGR